MRDWVMPTNLYKELEGPFDFVFSDADKEWYKNYFIALAPKVEILHQVFPRWHQVHQKRHFASQTIEILKIKGNLCPSGYSHQMQHKIGGASDRSIDADRILKRFPSENLQNRQILFDHFYDASACHVSQDLSSGVGRWDGCTSGQGEPKGLYHASHNGRDQAATLDTNPHTKMGVDRTHKDSMAL
jgi:hypothetical protein